jgi:hypothetical protein
MANDNEYKMPFSMLYPTFQVSAEGRIVPNIHLPENFRELVPKFYAQKRKGNVEQLVTDIRERQERAHMPLDIKLKWHPEDGLTNISVGHGGLDLIEDGMPSFQEHNLDGASSLIAAAIAQGYVSELLKSE